MLMMQTHVVILNSECRRNIYVLVNICTEEEFIYVTRCSAIPVNSPLLTMSTCTSITLDYRLMHQEPKSLRCTYSRVSSECNICFENIKKIVYP